MLEDEFIGWIPDQQEKAKVEITPGSSNKSNTPAIGMKFDCDDSAYEFYKDYAHRIFEILLELIVQGEQWNYKLNNNNNNETKRVVQ